MLRPLILALLAFAAPAFADTWNVNGTTITLGPPRVDGAVADIEYHNRPVNDLSSNGEHILTFDGIAVSITFTWNADRDSDRITIEAPPGYVAAPRTLDLPEDETGHVTIYPLDRVGM